MPDSPFIRRAYDYWISKGYSQPQAAALAANMQHESGGSTTVLGDKGTSQGLFQWHDTAPGVGRKTNLYAWAAANGRDPESEDTQLDFANQELQTTEKAAGDKIRAAKGYQEAQDATMGYLRGQGYTPDSPGSTIAYVNRYNLGAPLAGVDPITVPPFGASTTVASSQPADQNFAAPPADVLGQGVGNPMPTTLLPSPAANQRLLALASMGMENFGQGLLASGAQRNTWTPQAPMLQIHRPQPIPLPDFTRRGLLG